jgi:hypothetical protein
MCEVREHLMAEIHYKYSPLYDTSDPRDQSLGGAICKNKNLSHQGGHTNAWDEIKSWLPIKYIADPCHINI